MMTTQRLEEIRTQLEAAAPDGQTWSVGYDSCDCGDGWGCQHGSWPHAIYGPTNVQMLDRSEEIREGYGHTVGEIAELSDEAAELMASAPQTIRELLAEVERQRARAKFFEKAQRKVVSRFNVFADAHEQCDVSQEEHIQTLPVGATITGLDHTPCTTTEGVA